MQKEADTNANADNEANTNANICEAEIDAEAYG